MKRTFFIFRHGETDWNHQQRFQGHLDIPLNDTGRIQARGLIPHLKDHSIEAILSSDLCRAVETAQIIATSLKIPVFQDERLREAHLGAAQGLTRQEIEEQLGKDLLMKWKSPHLSDADVSYPGGETGVEVFQRTLAAIQHFFHSHPFQKVGIASHGGVIRRLMQNVMPPGSPSVPIPNGVVYQLYFDGHTKQVILD
jgi:probable phosphoglycerate mutase